MRWVLLLLLKISRVRRRFLGRETPHWFKDAAGLLSYVNVLALLPTFCAIALAPDHFFRRLPQYLKRGNSWFTNPTKFITSSAALIAAAVFLVTKEDMLRMGVTESSIYWNIVAISISPPVVMPVICALLVILWALGKLAFGYGLSPQWALWDLLIPLSPSSYARLYYSNFAWGVLYYGIYFYTCLPIIILIVNIGFIYLSFGFQDHSLLFMTPSMGGVAGTILFFAWVLLVRPYTALIRFTVVIPTVHMHRYDCSILKDAMDACGNWITDSEGKQLEEYIPTLRWFVGGQEAMVADQDARFLFTTSHYRDTLVRERDSVYRKMLSTMQLRTLIIERSGGISLPAEINLLLDRIDQIAATGHASALTKASEGTT